MYKIELHLHTKYSSGCGQMSAKELIDGYLDAGYDAIVVTDHYNRDTYRMKNIDTTAPGDKLTPFLEGYRKMMEEAEGRGIRIYRGAELRFDGSFNDYLLYNYPDELLEDPEALFTMGLHEFIKLSRAAGALLIQAHPFRVMCDPAEPADLDGIEVRNMHPGHNSRNHLAQALADEHPHLLQTGGSDCHQESHLGRGGILSETLPKDEAELVTLLKSGKFEIIGK